MFAFAAHTQTFDAFFLNLADTLAGEAELHGYLVETEGVGHADAEVHLDDLALVLGEGGEGALDFLREGFLHQGAVGGRCVFVGQHIDEIDVFVGHKRSVDGDMAARDAEDALDFLLGDVEHVGKFLFRWRALKLLFQAADFFFEFIEGSQLVGGETHDARVLGDGLKDGLAYPPNGVGDEFESACFVETLGGLNQTHVAFVDEVGKAEALVLVLLGNGDDEAQVGLGEAVEGFLVRLVMEWVIFNCLMAYI